MARKFRGNYRGNYRRGRKWSSLSTRNIFANRSAKSQANQIYKLRKRLNYLSKLNKPETKVLYTNANSFSFDSQTILNTYKSFLVPLPSLGTGDSDRIGDFIRVKSLQLNISAEYYNNAPSGFHNSESSGSAYRIIVGQYKRTSPFSAPTIGGVLQESSNTGSAYTNQSVCPLKTGQTEFSSILFDKSYTISINKNQAIHKFRIKPDDIRFDDANSEANYIWVIILSAGLHHDNNFSEFIEGTYSTKIVYTDA